MAAAGGRGGRGPDRDDLRAAAAADGDGVAMTWDGGSWTWRELDEAADRAAERCRAAGAPPGTVGAVRLPTGPDAAAAVFGLWRAGLAAAPLHERLSEAELDHGLRLLRPALQFLPGGAAGRVALGGATGRPPLRPDEAGALSGVAVWLLTSGTSGGAKAVGISRAAFAASAAAAARRLGLGPGDRWGLCLSLAHVGGLAIVLRAAALGCSVRCWGRFDAGAVADALAAGEVSHVSLVPAMLARVLGRLEGRRPPPRLRCVLVGGAALSPGLLGRALGAGLPVAPTWGMTETASQAATAPPSLARRLPGTVGRPLPGLEAKADDASGRLSVRGPTLASAVIRREGGAPEPLPVDSEGWFRTSDAGRVDEDGRVWVEGRSDDAIVTGGVNVAPGEVERVIEELPGVVEAVVFGVPDAAWGQRVEAVVEAAAGAVDPAAVDRHCRARLSRARCPSRIVVVGALPRTPTGKPDRAAIAGAAMAAAPPAAQGGGPVQAAGGPAPSLASTP